MQLFVIVLAFSVASVRLSVKNTDPRVAVPLTTSARTVVDTAPDCDVVSDGPICFGDGSGRQQVLLPPAVTPGTVGLWTFDEERALDSSGHNNHAVTSVVAGPSPMQGYSASFFNTFLMIPHSPSFPTTDWSYTFWLYLMDNSEPAVSEYCPVLRKGINDPASQQHFDAPSVLFDKGTKKLRLSVTTNVDRTLFGEHVDSNARLSNNRWFHIGVVHYQQAKTTRLYVNGVLDSTLGGKGFAEPNEYPLYVGGDPYTKCDLPLLIDELQVLDRAASPSELQAAAAFASGAEASFVRLACVDCPLAVAIRIVLSHITCARRSNFIAEPCRSPARSDGSERTRTCGLTRQLCPLLAVPLTSPFVRAPAPQSASSSLALALVFAAPTQPKARQKKREVFYTMHCSIFLCFLLVA
eukprot:GEMP01047246.1.p1 GENE.GEMP01047246.1~~GEMP01047246.1.p1  ORF type:complete len:410 (+),score=99.33 GEMP01047246.1:126-1355(+)